MHTHLRGVLVFCFEKPRCLERNTAVKIVTFKALTGLENNCILAAPLLEGVGIISAC